MRRPRIAPSVVRIAERVGFVAYLLVAVYLIGGYAAEKAIGGTRPTPSATATESVSTAMGPSPTPTAALSATPTASARPTPDPLVATAYRNGGRRFAALEVPIGYTLTSPINGTVTIVVYQFLGGEVRVRSNIPSEPFFPYITVTSADRIVVLRPGALERDVQLLVRDGQAVELGSPLFRTVGSGASSWRTFYDRSVTAQVIASAASRPSGAELDPVPLFQR